MFRHDPWANSTDRIAVTAAKYNFDNATGDVNANRQAIGVRDPG